MSVYRPKDPKTGKPRTQYYLFDFKVKILGKGEAQRFHGSTGQKTRRAAEAYEDRIRELAALGQLTSALTVEQACWRYWEEVAEHKKSARDQAKNLELVAKYLGPDTLLVSISPEMVADAARRRMRAPIERMQVICGKKVLAPTNQFPKPATVNRQIIEPLRRLLLRAKRVWRVPLDLEQFHWSDLGYDEGAPRTRELGIEEERRFWQALRPDYAPLCELYLISGRRRSDWIGLTKFKIDRTAGTVRFPTRKRKEVGEIVVELTQRELEIIGEECDKAPDSVFVFTYEVQKGKHKGKRLPITKDGLRQVTDAAFRKAGIEDFRRHDFRHSFASRALRAGADLRSLMGAMDHQDISSTVRYAHLAKNQVKDTRSRVTVNRQLPDNVTPLRREKS
jgi:integrase